VKLILNNPKRYGFHLSDNDYYPELKTERIEILCVQDIPIRIIAKSAKTHFKMAKDLNPEIRGYSLVKGKHTILVPRGSAEGFQKRYGRYSKAFLAAQKNKIYIVKKGDNLSMIADRFDVPLKSLIMWNSLDPNRPIHPGDHLIVSPK
jgi:hypothetical protein